MSARRKKGSPMKYRGFYCDDTLYEEMQRCAEIADESDSEYIRKAIEQRNAYYKNGYANSKPPEEFRLTKDNVYDTLTTAKKQEHKTFFKSK